MLVCACLEIACQTIRPADDKRDFLNPASFPALHVSSELLRRPLSTLRIQKHRYRAGTESVCDAFRLPFDARLVRAPKFSQFSHFTTYKVTESPGVIVNEGAHSRIASLPCPYDSNEHRLSTDYTDFTELFG